jgi:uncharacterized protein (DUF2267 family)
MRDLVSAFQARTGIASREEAERSLIDLAEELGGSLTWVEAHNLADLLPEPLAGRLRRATYESSMARFSVSAFLTGLAQREGVDEEEAARRAAAFFGMLREMLPAVRWARLAEELQRYGGLIGGRR